MGLPVPRRAHVALHDPVVLTRTEVDAAHLAPECAQALDERAADEAVGAGHEDALRRSGGDRRSLSRKHAAEALRQAFARPVPPGAIPPVVLAHVVPEGTRPSRPGAPK